MNKIISVLRDIRDYYHNIFKAPNTFKISTYDSLKMKTKGFTPNQYVLYNFKDNDPSDYINEMDRWRTRRINGYYNIILDDKIIFNEVFQKYLNLPKVLMISYNGCLYCEKGSQLNFNQFKCTLEKNKKMFVRPIVGGGGSGIYQLTLENHDVYKNNELMTLDQVYKELIKENNILTEVVTQDSYSDRINPNSVNTIRILTYYDSQVNDVKVLDAVHRFGTKDTFPVDNVSSGGLFSLIDVQTGVLSAAKDYKNKEYTLHPDTGVTIEGQTVPGWKDIIMNCEKVASSFFYIPYLAWDIVKVEDGFKVIEINASSGLTLFQMWEGKRDNKLGKYLKT